MKKLLLLLLFCSLSLGCDNTSVEEKIGHLNGYWEIKTAELPDGSSREFRFSEMVDYLKVENREGFRKKVRPQLGGTFITSDDQEAFHVEVKNDSIHLFYETPYASWKETLLSSEEDKLRIRNDQGIIYTYTRFTPYNSDYEEEE